MFIDFREGGRDRERDPWEKHQLFASHRCPDLGLNPQSRYVPQPGIEPATFWCRDDAPINWATWSRLEGHLRSHFLLLGRTTLKPVQLSQQHLLSTYSGQVLGTQTLLQWLESYSWRKHLTNNDTIIFLSSHKRGFPGPDENCIETRRFSHWELKQECKLTKEQGLCSWRENKMSSNPEGVITASMD